MQSRLIYSYIDSPIGNLLLAGDGEALSLQGGNSMLILQGS